MPYKADVISNINFLSKIRKRLCDLQNNTMQENAGTLKASCLLDFFKSDLIKVSPCDKPRPTGIYHSFTKLPPTIPYKKSHRPGMDF